MSIVEIVGDGVIVIDGVFVETEGLPKKEYQVSGTATFNTAMSEIEAVSEEHAKAIFIRDWRDEVGEEELEIDEDNLSVEEE